MMIHLLEKITQGTSTIDEAHGRVYGWIPGIVTDIDTNLFRVKARIGKQGDNESTEWLVPMGVGSIETTPEVGDPIGVSFADGDVHRGAYFYFPQSTTKGRPMSPIPLGDVTVGLLNNVVDQLQNIVQTIFNAHGHSYVYGTTGPPASPMNMQLGKGLASDGSIVPSVNSSKKALSKRSRVR